jgi:hypothetical protein
MIDPVMWSKAIRDDREREGAKRRLIRLATEPGRERGTCPSRPRSGTALASCVPAPAVPMRCCKMGGCA